MQLKNNYLFIFILTILAIGLWIGINIYRWESGSVKMSDNVNVTASVYSCVLDITIYPEKRIPATNNWATDLTIDIYDDTETTFFGTATATTNTAGNAVIDLCGQSINLVNGDYLLKIRGTSHLYKDFIVVNAFQTAGEVVSFAAPSDRLLAGETSVVFDNYVNALDISTQIVNYDTGDYVNDLNQDGTVNALDISNTIFNYGTSGD